MAEKINTDYIKRLTYSYFNFRTNCNFWLSIVCFKVEYFFNKHLKFLSSLKKCHYMKIEKREQFSVNTLLQFSINFFWIFFLFSLNFLITFLRRKVLLNELLLVTARLLKTHAHLYVVWQQRITLLINFLFEIECGTQAMPSIDFVSKKVGHLVNVRHVGIQN